jgi:hypothetical protein
MRIKKSNGNDEGQTNDLVGKELREVLQDFTSVSNTQEIQN